MTDHLEQAAAKAVELADELARRGPDLDARAALHLTYLAGLIRGGAVRASGCSGLHHSSVPCEHCSPSDPDRDGEPDPLRFDTLGQLGDINEVLRYTTTTSVVQLLNDRNRLMHAARDVVMDPEVPHIPTVTRLAGLMSEIGPFVEKVEGDRGSASPL